MKCGSKCENVKIQMGDYFLKSHMYAMKIGGWDVIHGAKWLQILCPVTMNFKELWMRFSKEGFKHIVKGLQSISP
jgi:hypothetical protein